MIRLLPLCAAACLSAGPALAQLQYFNVDLGSPKSPAGVPTSAFAAGAGSVQAGAWNGIDLTLPGPYALTETGGASTSVLMSVVGLKTNYTFDDPATSGDDQSLLDDVLDLGSTLGNASTLTFTGLANGAFDVLVYTHAPDNASFRTDVTVVGGVLGKQTGGGAPFSGAYVEPAIFVRDTVIVTNNTLVVRCEVSVTGEFGSVNGLQIARAGCLGMPSSYCVAKTNSLGCIPMIGSQGIPSASNQTPFVVSVQQVRNNKAGLYFYSVSGQQVALPFQGGTLCIAPVGIKRTPAKKAGGHPPPANDCSGVYQLDFSAFAAGLAGGNPLPELQVPGSTVLVQAWGRDQGFPAPMNTTLSDALAFTMCQ